MNKAILPLDRGRVSERQVLGIMLRDRLAIDDVRRILPKEESFGCDAHQKIYRAIIDLHADARPIDSIFVSEELHRRKQLDDAGGRAYLAELYSEACTPGMVAHYCREVLNAALLRGLFSVGGMIQRDAADPYGPATDLISNTARELDQLGEAAIINEPVEFQEALERQLDTINQRTKRGETAGIPTGYADLDKIIVGLQPSEFIITGARPSVGKTALITNIARNLCSAGRSIFFASLEQSREELSERLLACEAKVDSYRMRTGAIDNDDSDRLIEAQAEMRRWKLFIDDSPVQNVTRIITNARRQHRRRGLDAVFVDYLQLIEPDNRRDDRYQQVGLISRRLKQLARDLKIPVVAACQVGRDSDENEPPKLRHLRESGNIEQDLDLCLLLCRGAVDEEAGTETIGVEVAKNRNGRRGKFLLTYLRKYTRFENHASGPII